MAWEVIVNRCGRQNANRSSDNWIYFPGTKTKKGSSSPNHSRLELSPSLKKEMRWELGDAMLCMIDRESKLLAIKRDKSGPTQLSSAVSSKRLGDCDGNANGRIRLTLQRDMTIALCEMWSLTDREQSLSFDLEYIVDGSMVIFSRKQP